MAFSPCCWQVSFCTPSALAPGLLVATSGHGRELAAIVSCGLVLQLACGILLVPRLGPAGAALGHLAGSGLVALTHLLLARRILDAPSAVDASFVAAADRSQ